MRQFKGISAFAMLHERFPLKRFIDCFPPHLRYPCTAILANRFGVQWQKLTRWCETFEQPHAVEAHFMSGPSRRNRSWDMYDPWPGVTVTDFNKAIIAGYLPRLEQKVHKFALMLGGSVTDKTKVFICPELEDNLSDKAFETLLKVFRAEFKTWRPKVTFVRSPCTIGKSLFGCLYELHGYATKPCNIYNPDGLSVDFQDKEHYFNTMSVSALSTAFARHSDATLRLIWSANMQGVGGASSFNYKPPTQRTPVVTDNAISWCKLILKNA